MSHDERIPADLAAIEARLATLAVEPAGIDRDQLLFAAGLAAGRSRGMPWRVVAGTAFVTAASVLLAVLPWLQTDRVDPSLAEMTTTLPPPGERSIAPPNPREEVGVSRDRPWTTTVRFDRSVAPLLVAREQALRFRHEPAQPYDSAIRAVSRAATSLGDLRGELLPTGSPVPSFGFPQILRWLQEDGGTSSDGQADRSDRDVIPMLEASSSTLRRGTNI